MKLVKVVLSISILLNFSNAFAGTCKLKGSGAIVIVKDDPIKVVVRQDKDWGGKTSDVTSAKECRNRAIIQSKSYDFVIWSFEDTDHEITHYRSSSMMVPIISTYYPVVSGKVDRLTPMESEATGDQRSLRVPCQANFSKSEDPGEYYKDKYDHGAWLIFVPDSKRTKDHFYPFIQQQCKNAVIQQMAQKLTSSMYPYEFANWIVFYGEKYGLHSSVTTLTKEAADEAIDQGNLDQTYIFTADYFK